MMSPAWGWIHPRCAAVLEDISALRFWKWRGKNDCDKGFRLWRRVSASLMRRSMRVLNRRMLSAMPLPAFWGFRQHSCKRMVCSALTGSGRRSVR
ncbi:hypothetical protein D9M70_581380 [compost metagenome]